MLDISFIPAFKDNYIWLLRNGNEAAVVDPGDAEPVLAKLRDEGLDLKAILITHHHTDHQGGVSALTAHFPVPVYVPAKESITGGTHPVSDGMIVSLLGVDFEVMDVPGHTAGHVAYRGQGALFCGDTLFGAGCGRLFEGTPRQMWQSLSRFAALPEDTRVYCAHEYTQTNLRFAAQVEPANAAIQARIRRVEMLREAGQSTIPSTIGDELATNPLMRWNAEAVISAALQRDPECRLPHEVFAAIRAWRDQF